MVKVSVLMPVYKTDEKYLREAIESILNQTFTDFEFIILDDCPDDDRENIVKSYQDKRIRYSKNEKNLGITPSRNKLIDMAKGEYLAVFDHDDISLPKRLEKQVKYLDNHPDVGVVGCSFKSMSDNKVHIWPKEDSLIKMLSMCYCSICHPASMIRKSVLINNNIRYEERFSPSEDYALWCRLIPYTNFHNLDEVLFLYRNHEQNTSHNQSDKMSRSAIEIRSFVKVMNPILYEEFLQFATQTTRYNLFGIIPFISVKSKGDKKCFYLFEKILLLRVKNSIKLQNVK